jgi:hypothetical protein
MPKLKRRYFLWILFAFIILPAHAQKKGYSRGYIINCEGETGEKVEEWIQENAPPESSISFLTPIFLTVHSGHIEQLCPVINEQSIQG